MPQLIRFVDEIMQEAGRDMMFVRFGSPFNVTRVSHAAMRRHLVWFRKRVIPTEVAAPRGWMEGDPQRLAVHFAGLGDPRIAEYVAEFEHADGRSLNPSAYQMCVLSFDAWKRDHEAYLARRREQPNDDDW